MLQTISLLIAGLLPGGPPRRQPAAMSAATVTTNRPASSGQSLPFSELQTAGFVVVPDFVPAAMVDALRTDVSKLRAAGRFATAGVGESSTNRVDAQVRVCEQAFLFPQFKHQGGGDPDARSTLYATLESLREALIAGCGQPLEALLTEGLYACYPHGGYYRRHVDAAEGTASAQRVWSFLLYLNKEWTEADGGCLRIHTDGVSLRHPCPCAARAVRHRSAHVGAGRGAGAARCSTLLRGRAATRRHVRSRPSKRHPLCSNTSRPSHPHRLVVFRSSLPHEVLETTSSRQAVVGWFNAPVQGTAVRRGLIAALGGALVVGGAAKFVAGGLGGDGRS